MKSKLTVAILALAAFSMPALAADAAFYVAKDAATKTCEVTDKKPDGTKVTMIGKNTYKTKADAEAAMKAAADCK